MSGANYEIVISSRLGGAMLQWFDELELRASGPDATHLIGWFPDQAALHGVLRQLGDLGLELASLRRLPPCPAVERADDDHVTPDRAPGLGGSPLGGRRRRASGRSSGGGS